jgi:hypothetical protein
MNTLELNHLVEREELLQTNSFSEIYTKQLERDSKELHSEYLIENIYDLKNSILSELESKISENQRISLLNIFEEFVMIQKLIDPSRLKEFKYCMSNDGEILLYRRTANGLSNVIIDDEDSVVFSFIPFDSSKKSILEHFNDGDLQKAALLLFTH